MKDEQREPGDLSRDGGQRARRSGRARACVRAVRFGARRGKHQWGGRSCLSKGGERASGGIRAPRARSSFTPPRRPMPKVHEIGLPSATRTAAPAARGRAGRPFGRASPACGGVVPVDEGRAVPFAREGSIPVARASCPCGRCSNGRPPRIGRTKLIPRPPPLSPSPPSTRTPGTGQSWRGGRNGRPGRGPSAAKTAARDAPIDTPPTQRRSGPSTATANSPGPSVWCGETKTRSR